MVHEGDYVTATSGWYIYSEQPEDWVVEDDDAIENTMHNGCGGRLAWAGNGSNLADCEKCGGRFHFVADRPAFLFRYRAPDTYEPPAPKLVWVTRQDGTRHTSLVEVDGGLERVKLW